MTKLLNIGDKYTHIVANPNSTLYGEWIVLEVNNEITYGYLQNDVYILHNTVGPSFISTVTNPNFDPNIYALHGIIYEKEEWLKRIRENKLKRILIIK